MWGAAHKTEGFREEVPPQLPPEEWARLRCGGCGREWGAGGRSSKGRGGPRVDVLGAGLGLRGVFT